jgi:hypothetical protein
MTGACDSGPFIVWWLARIRCANHCRFCSTPAAAAAAART